MVNMVAVASGAAGLSGWPIADDTVGFSPHHNNLQGWQRIYCGLHFGGGRYLADARVRGQAILCM